jgi:hypothetical protein
MTIKNLLALAALAIGTATVAKADAISISGNDSYNGTTITLFGPSGVGGTSTGIFSGFADCAACVTYPGAGDTVTINYTSFTPELIYTIVDGSHTATLTLESISAVNDNLEIIGPALINVDGTVYNGQFDLTTQQGPTTGTNKVTFSETSTVTPEPASLALFGTGLLSVVGLARRKFSV